MVTSTIQQLMPSRLILRVKFRPTAPSTNVVNTNPSKLCDTKMAFLRLIFSVLTCILCWTFLIAADIYALHFNHPEFSLATMTWRRTVVLGVLWGFLLLDSLILFLILVQEWKSGRTQVQAKHLLIIFVMTMILATPLVGLLFETKESLRAGWVVIALFVTSQISCFLIIIPFYGFGLLQFTWTTGSWTAVFVSAFEFLYMTVIRTHYHTEDRSLDRFTLSHNLFGTLLGLMLTLCVVLDAHLMLKDRWSVLPILFRLMGDQHWMGVVVLPYFSADNQGEQQSAVNTLQQSKKQKGCTNEYMSCNQDF